MRERAATGGDKAYAGVMRFVAKREQGSGGRCEVWDANGSCVTRANARAVRVNLIDMCPLP